MEPDHAQMRDGVESARDFAQPARRQQERITAGDDDLPDLVPRTDVIERGFQLVRRQLLPVPSHLLTAEAEPAIDRAKMRRLQENAIGIAVDDALHRGKL